MKQAAQARARHHGGAALLCFVATPHFTTCYQLASVTSSKSLTNQPQHPR